MYQNYPEVLFVTTMVSLLEENTIENITVAQITEKSGLSRSTFYRYFKDKYDLMNFSHESLSRQHMKHYNGENLEEVLIKVYSEMAQRKNFYRNALRTWGNNSFADFWTQYSNTMTDFFVKIDFPDTELNNQMRMLVVYTAGGTVQILKDWIGSQMQEDPKSLAKWISESYYTLLRKLKDTPAL